MDLKFLPEKNRENAKELLTKCKKACKVLKKCVK